MPTLAPTKLPLAQRFSSLATLRLIRAVILALDALLLLAIVTGVHVHRDAMQIIGRDAAPSIIAAQHIKAAMADMDGQAANELLGQAGTDSAAARAYEARRIEAVRALVNAAENITYGESERKPILILQVGLGTYERMVQHARDLQATSQPAAVQAYNSASDLMNLTLQPAADALDQANNEVLNATYKRQSLDSAWARTFVVLAALALLAALIFTQLWLSHRTRRTLNPLLVLATLSTVLLTTISFGDLSMEQHQLRAAREDAFASIYVLWLGRALGYQADAAESHVLLHSDDGDSTFNSAARALVTSPAGVTPEDLLARLRAGQRVPGFKGLLADELNNITYPGEREAAVHALESWDRFLEVDTELHELERNGQHQQAVALDLGNSATESNWSFQQFDQALGDTLAINQNAFDAAVTKGFAALNNLDWKATAAAVLIALLALFGLAPRIREYQ